MAFFCNCFVSFLILHKKYSYSKLQTGKQAQAGKEAAIICKIPKIVMFSRSFIQFYLSREFEIMIALMEWRQV